MEGRMNALIIPVYKNEDTIEELTGAVRKIRRGTGGQFTAVFVVDGSPDKSYERLVKLLPKAGFKSRLITHSRNFGSFAAIRTGMELVEAEKYAVMAADLQEPEELISGFFRGLKPNKADILFGTRTGRNDPFFSRLFSAVFWRFYRAFIVKDMPKGGVDVFGCVRKVRDYIVSFRESHSSLVGQLFWVGFKRGFVGYDRIARKKGKSAWTFGKKFNYLLDSVFAVTDLPIKTFILIGSAGIVFSAVFAAVVVVSRLMGMIEVTGYTAIIVTLVFFSALNILGLGIVGAYAHRAYENSKNRPLTIVVEDKKYGG